MLEVSEKKSYFGGQDIPFEKRARDLVNDTYIGSKQNGWSLSETYLLLGVHCAMLMEATQVIKDYESEFGTLDPSVGRRRRSLQRGERQRSETSGATREVPSSMAD